MKLPETLAYYQRLQTLIRFSTRPRLCDESVASHSFSVALIALMLARRIQSRYDYDIDVSSMLTMAIIHDLPEAEYGDITHPVKLGLGIDMEERERKFFQQGIDKQLIIEFQKQTSLEAKIVAFADILAVREQARLELSLGNSHFKFVYDDTESRLASFVWNDELVGNWVLEASDDVMGYHDPSEEWDFRL